MASSSTNMEVALRAALAVVSALTPRPSAGVNTGAVAHDDVGNELACLEEMFSCVICRSRCVIDTDCTSALLLPCVHAVHSHCLQASKLENCPRCIKPTPGAVSGFTVPLAPARDALLAQLLQSSSATLSSSLSVNTAAATAGDAAAAAATAVGQPNVYVTYIAFFDMLRSGKERVSPVALSDAWKRLCDSAHLLPSDFPHRALFVNAANTRGEMPPMTDILAAAEPIQEQFNARCLGQMRLQSLQKLSSLVTALTATGQRNANCEREREQRTQPGETTVDQREESSSKRQAVSTTTTTTTAAAAVAAVNPFSSSAPASFGGMKILPADTPGVTISSGAPSVSGGGGGGMRKPQLTFSRGPSSSGSCFNTSTSTGACASPSFGKGNDNGFPAKWDSKFPCVVCKRHYKQGEMITKHNTSWIHAGCKPAS